MPRGDVSETLFFSGISQTSSCGMCSQIIGPIIGPNKEPQLPRKRPCGVPIHKQYNSTKQSSGGLNYR